MVVKVPLTERWAIIGGRVVLPCSVSPSAPGDTPLLMLFSRGETPIYSVDARGSGSLDTAVYWSSPELIGTRGRFLPSGGGGLEIRPVEAQDQSDYHCRVEFKDSPTRNSRVRLLIVVVPEAPIIIDEKGNKVSGVIGPYTLGKTTTLSCHVRGGYPKPRVTWWHEHFLLDDLSEVTGGPDTINRMTLPNLSRQHLNRKLTCQAANSNLTKAIQASVMLNMSFPPASVDILGSEGPLSEGRQYSLECEATGSRPPAALVWYSNGQKLNQSRAMDVFKDGQTRSSLLLNPTREDNGRAVTCRGTNPLLPDMFKEDVRLLDVQYQPQLTLRLGTSLDRKNIKEHEDVYFECEVKSNPTVSSIQWFHNGVEMKDNKSAGIILTNRSLVLQQIARSSSGRYACRGANSEGEGESAPLALQVQYTPVCAPQQQWVYGGGRREPVNITCLVESYPIPHSFSWSLNTSSSDLVDVPRSRAYKRGLSSVLAYTPQTPLDYGSLLCWAENSVGRQQQACVYQVVPAAVPESVHNCSAWHNSTASGLVVVRCWRGWDGGLKQLFSLEVREGAEGPVVASLPSQVSPRFTVTGLRPGLEYLLQVTASNSQGEAAPVTITHLTPIDIAEKRLSKGPNSGGGVGVSTAIGVLAASAAGMLLCCIGMVLLLRVRSSSAAAQRRKQVETKINLNGGADGSVDGGSRCLKPDRDPDVILVSADPREDLDDRDILQSQKIAIRDTVYVNPGTLVKTSRTAASGGPPIAARYSIDTGPLLLPEARHSTYRGSSVIAAEYSLNKKTEPTSLGPSNPPEPPANELEIINSAVNKEENLLRVESLQEKEVGRLSSSRCSGISGGRLNSPQRESIV